MAIITQSGHVSRAKDFFKKTSLYYAIGRTTAWTDDTVPPIPSETDTMQEIIGYKKITSKSLVVPSSSGTLVFGDTKWKIVTSENAETEGARWVYVSATLESGDFPSGTVYRQVGIFSGLKRNTSVTDKSVLLPAEVSSSGTLELLDNRKPITRSSDQNEQIVNIIKF